jgi:hypothetical protein
MIAQNNVMGLDGFVWWFGVVENRKDPLTLGRCQVRIFGWHTENKTQIPTRDLPWAHPIVPLGANASSMVAPKEGEMVFGFFLDGDDGQFPAMLGIVPGIPEGTPRIDKGFSDPRDDLALRQSPQTVGTRTYNTDGGGASFINEISKRFPSISNEATISRLARNENIDDTIVAVKKQTTVENVVGAKDDYWSEPQTKYAAVYPYNHVYESESGHVMEFDDTPNAERVHIAHRSGTFEEIHPDGSKVTKVVNKNYEVVMSDNHLYVMGDCSITINGSGSVFVRGDLDLKVGGNMTTTVKGDYNVTSTGNMKFLAPRIDLNPDGQTATYVDQIYDPSTAVIEKRQVPGGTGSFVFAGVTLNVSPNYASTSPDYVAKDAPPQTVETQSANTDPAPPVTCGDFSETLTESDYNKNISANYRLRDLTIGCLFPYRINSQRGLKESDIACNLQALAINCLEPLRSQYPGMRINSAFRVGESQSQHGVGQAADVSWPNKNKSQLLEICKWASENLTYDQIIYEIPPSSQTGWLHISFNRNGNRPKSMLPPNRPKLLTWRGGAYETGLVA